MTEETKKDPSLEKGTAEGAAPAGPTAADEGAKAPEKSEREGDAEVLRLKNKLAKLEKQLVNLGPYAQFGMAVAQDERGRQVASRFQQGQVLFPSDGDEEGTEPTKASVPAGVTRDELVATLDAREGAKRQIEDLMDLAQERLPEFKKLRRSEKFSRVYNSALATVWNDPNWERDASPEVLTWGDENMARNYTALELAYRWHLASDPKVIEAAKEAGKKEAQERAGAALAGSVSSASGAKTTSETSGEKTAAEEMIQRMMDSSAKGKSFKTVAPRRR